MHDVLIPQLVPGYGILVLLTYAEVCQLETCLGHQPMFQIAMSICISTLSCPCKQQWLYQTDTF